MTKRFYFGFFLAVLLLLSFCVHAQTQGPADLIIKVSTNKGTYAKMVEQIQQVCPQPSITASPSSGTVEALDDLINNKANVAFLTTDVLYGRRDIEQDPAVNDLKVLMPLYIAEVHIIANRSNPNVNAFSDAGNKRVGVFGGAVITARILLAKANLRPASYEQFATEDALLKALADNKVDIGFIVVGQPATWALKANPNLYKLVPFDANGILASTGGFFQATLRYPNLSQTAVKTVGVRVSLVTYNYDEGKVVKDLATLKSCMTQNISKLKQTVGNHPKWREVNPRAGSDWPMYMIKASGVNYEQRPQHTKAKRVNSQ